MLVYRIKTIIMKIKSLYFLTILIISCYIFSSYSSGPASVNGNGYTGAPGEAFTCSGCHTGGAYGTTSESLEIRNAGGTLVTEYIPGATYSLELTISASMGTPAAYGFQMTSLENVGDTYVGTWQNAAANLKFSVGNSGRIYAEHNMRSLSNVFSMEWVAPALGTGGITFYHVGNSVNSASGTGGDIGGTGSFTSFPEVILPVELTSFQAKKKDQSVLLDWETASEINNKGFQIEHSSNGEDFKNIGWKEGAGNSTERLNYQFADDSPSLGTNYYRLLQMDFDGKSSYSDVKTVLFESSFKFDIFPNPAKEYAYMEFFTEKIQDVNINIFSSNGQLAMTKIASLQEGMNNLSIPIQELTRGIYIISVIHNNRVKNIKLNIVN